MRGGGVGSSGRTGTACALADAVTGRGSGAEGWAEVDRQQEINGFQKTIRNQGNAEVLQFVTNKASVPSRDMR